MRRTAHRTLLQSFRFWFVLLSIFALAAAWKLDLFGNRRSPRPGRIASEQLPLPDPDVEAVAMLSDVAGGINNSAPEPLDFQGVAPAPLPPHTEPKRRLATAENVASLARTPAAKSPFGPANPEFVAMPSDAPPLTETPARSIAAAQSEPTNDLPGQATTTEARPYQRGDLRRTASLEPTPPDLTAPRSFPTAMAERHSPAGDFTTDDRFQRASNSQSTSRLLNVEPATAAAPVKPAFTLPPGSKVDLSAIRQLLEDGDDIEAHRRMSEWYWKEPQSRPAFQQQLEQLARKIYLQPHPHYMDPHVVQPAQMLSSVAKEYSVPWQYLAKLNRTDPKRIKPGQKLKVIKGPFSAVVDLSDFELTIHAHGYFVKRYDVGIGRDNSSPYGQFKVLDKLTDPTYYGPTKVIEHDDPENPLGEYWISIGDSFGIHGTIDPDSIGKAESEGCIRLRNDDIAEVYDFLSIGSEVVIRP